MVEAVQRCRQGVAEDGELALLTRIPTYPNFGTSLFLNADYGPSRNSPWGSFGLVPTHVWTATWLILVGPVYIIRLSKMSLSK